MPVPVHVYAGTDDALFEVEIFREVATLRRHTQVPLEENDVFSERALCGDVCPIVCLIGCPIVYPIVSPIVCPIVHPIVYPIVQRHCLPHGPPHCPPHCPA